MFIENAPTPISIQLVPGESVAVASTIVTHTNIIQCTKTVSVTVKIYSDFFVIIVNDNGKATKEVFSDNWDFHIRGS